MYNWPKNVALKSNANFLHHLLQSGLFMLAKFGVYRVAQKVSHYQMIKKLY